MFSKATSVIVGASLLAMSHAFDGDGTFYGSGGAGKSGACMLNPGFNGVGVTVAMNVQQYENGAACGKCIKASGSGGGLGMTPIVGPIYATVDNECPECKFGDVDFGLGGDGRWRISWEFVSCDEARAASSNMPSQRNPNRSLRGLLESDEGRNLLLPGYMVTADGIKLISEVVAEQQAAEASNGQH